MREVVVAGAVRTPIGKFGGGLASLTAARLGAAAAKEALARAGIEPRQVDEAVFGCARQAGVGPNVARQVAHRAGIPQESPAFTVNMACGSGLKAIDLAYRAVRDGEAEIVLAGGTESMSRVPYLLTGARWGYRMGDQPAVDGMYQDGFLCPLSEMVMGETAERLAEVYEITREEQDAFALRSQQRATKAAAAGRFDDEIVPVRVAVKGSEPRCATTSTCGPTRRSRPSPGCLPSSRGRAAPSPRAIRRASRTARRPWSCSPAERAASLASRPWRSVVATAAAGVDPRIMGIGVVPATRRVLERTSLRDGGPGPRGDERGLRGPGARPATGS
jgi:acetyl-CoA C-acetyltransferase